MSKCGRKVEPPVLFCCNPLQAQADDNNACFESGGIEQQEEKRTYFISSSG